VPGRIGEEAFAWLADADPRLGPVLEAVVDGRYWWVPLAHVARLTTEPPADLRDIVWMPAHFQWANGGESVGLVPTRYPGSAESADAAIRLARRTEWVETAPGLQVGLGQRMLATDAGDHPLMEVREVRLDGTGDGAAAHSASGDG
jgi:type VI secretion system protein ImpE